MIVETLDHYSRRNYYWLVEALWCFACTMLDHSQTYELKTLSQETFYSSFAKEFCAHSAVAFGSETCLMLPACSDCILKVATLLSH